PRSGKRSCPATPSAEHKPHPCLGAPKANRRRRRCTGTENTSPRGQLETSSAWLATSASYGGFCNYAVIPADGSALAPDEVNLIWPTVDPAPAKHIRPVSDAGPSMLQPSPLPQIVEAARLRHQAATSRGNACQAVLSPANVS